MKKNICVKNGIVNYKKYHSIINFDLLKKQGIESESRIEKILKAHLERFKLFDLAEKTKSPKKLKSIGSTQREIEFYLQGLWGFERDAEKHVFWDIPNCSCENI